VQRGAALERQLRASEAFLERTGRTAGVGGYEVDLDSGQILWSDETCRIHEVPPGFTPASYEQALSFYPEPAREVVDAAVQRSVETGEGWDLELPLITRAAARSGCAPWGAWTWWTAGASCWAPSRM